jgi:hypothetical protein
MCAVGRAAGRGLVWRCVGGSSRPEALVGDLQARAHAEVVQPIRRHCFKSRRQEEGEVRVRHVLVFAAAGHAGRSAVGSIMAQPRRSVALFAVSIGCTRHSNAKHGSDGMRERGGGGGRSLELPVQNVLEQVRWEVVNRREGVKVVADHVHAQLHEGGHSADRRATLVLLHGRRLRRPRPNHPPVRAHTGAERVRRLGRAAAERLVAMYIDRGYDARYAPCISSVCGPVCLARATGARERGAPDRAE